LRNRAITALKTARLGSFDAETFWRDPGLASLPTLPDHTTRRIVTAMDELLFLGCNVGDLLLTRFPMQAAFVHYLEQIGFAFEHNADPLESEEIQEPQASIFDILFKDPPAACELLTGVSQIAPYAILSGAQEFCQKYSIPFDGPSLATVVKANSKAVSHEMAVELGLKNFGCLVGSSSDLVEQGMCILATRPLLIKDLFGVSGKGSLVVQSESMLKRIGAHLAAQEKKGKRVSLLIEPFLAKKLDFSCQMRIEPDGHVRFLGLQKIHNRQLAYYGSSRLDEEQVGILERGGYFRQMEAFAACLYKDGYWGNVCIDSMQLEDGNVVPVVEINARESMGLLNYHLDQLFAQDRLCSYFTFLLVGHPGPLDFGKLLGILDQAGLLFTCRSARGILPLSANALTINLNQPSPTPSAYPMRKGRFYFSILAHPEERQVWLKSLRDAFQDFGFTLYS
jgi:hypothetical protein